MFEEADELMRFTSLGFPDEAKVRVSITGLAFCDLDTEESKIKFLSHVPDHDLFLTIKKKIRDTGVAYPSRFFKIRPSDPVSLEVSGSTAPASIKTLGDYPLEEILNLQELHGGPVEFNLPAGISPPSVVTLRHCAFYTEKMHSTPFEIVEIPSATKRAPDHIGYKMGGIINAPRDSTVTIKSPSLLVPDNVIELPGVNEMDQSLIYEFIFDNHCTDTKKCNQQLGETKSDFFYYYHVLSEPGNVGRKFDLQPPIIPIGPGEGRPGGGDGVPACNVTIEKPAPPY